MPVIQSSSVSPAPTPPETKLSFIILNRRGPGGSLRDSIISTNRATKGQTKHKRGEVMRKLTFLFVVIIALLVLVPSTISQRTSVSRNFPVYDNGGKPDLVVDPQRFVSQMEIVDRFFTEQGCAFQEGAVGATGYRRILRFDTVVMNSGDGDLVVGDRSDPNNQYAEFFEFAPCHGHFHIRDFSVYELLSLDRQLVIAAHKQGFCMEDSLKYDGGKSSGFDCRFQGITSGWGDWYFKQLTGQWIDIT